MLARPSAYSFPLTQAWPRQLIHSCLCCAWQYGCRGSPSQTPLFLTIGSEKLFYTPKLAFFTMINCFEMFVSELVVVEQIGNVMTIGINRPEVRNCVNPATATQLFDAFNHFEETEDAYVAVFHGKGERKCVYHDAFVCVNHFAFTFSATKYPSVQIFSDISERKTDTYVQMLLLIYFLL